jgi:hypothetical protein
MTIPAWSQESLPELGFPLASSTKRGAIKVRSIYGIVADEHGAVIPAADVIVRQEFAGDVREITRGKSDAMGRFKMNAPNGNYEVAISRLGFKQVTVFVHVRSDGGPGFKVVMTVQETVLVN